MKNIRKFDAVPKLNGSWKFLDDYNYQDMIFGQLLYSTCHHGIIKEIKFPEGFDLQEFTLVSAHDIPGENIVPEPECDQPFMAEKEVFHYGQVIMGIAHPNKKTLKDFIKKTIVVYEELPAITDIKECLDNVENAFGKELIIDHRRNIKIEPDWLHHHEVYYTPHQEQAYLETQGMIAIWKPEEKIMFVRATSQCPFFVKDGVEAIMGNAIHEAIVETSEGIGGAFGGKEDFPSLLAGITSLLSFKSGKPVKSVLDRSDDILITTKRHPSRVEIDTWTDPQTKKIRKIEIDYRLDAGGYQTLSPVVLSRGVLHAIGGYEIPDSYIHGRLMRSNTPSNGAFRGFGAPQAFAAIEAHVDNIAADLEMDPVAFRRINLFRIGSEFPSTQKIIEDHLYDCLKHVVEKSDYFKKVQEYREWNKTHKDKKGIGVSVGYHGGGYTGNGEKVLNSEVKVIINKEANVEIYVANTDMGQGAHTTLAQMFFEAIDHPREKCWVQLPNTSKTPNSGPTVASRTIYIIGNLLQDLALEIKEKLGFENLEEYVAAHQNEFPKEFHRNFKPDPSVQFDEETYQGTGYKDYSWAACVTEIYYHADTYKIELTKNWSVLDIGKLANPKIAMGQAEGGIVQGLGYGLSEFFYKPEFGRMHGFTDYTLPTSVDIPKMNIEFIHTDSPIAKGLGEIPMDFPAPSIRNAVLFALGTKINEYPMTPENIFKKLHQPQTCTDGHRQ
ncbi:MAG: molybdopterin-dependent oxidoreductase [Candidatus Cloacimonetes bacterium]|nr:molybdopterin-dependent oxidoreductase [Candidatus Cloacimonadota bacterium]MCF7814712.1 molybdopterin-dependent oxidoreductase [Candidatus Cloacimonadota bacterium]MCF7868167.1 molybdopterin-dependent oxidoreductase [Candidatus Cloacimonadota bacterium]MCF7884481.1 molybdopterin-dependent oxidoreductase [Candidatus Cloacimonadota bacterium]